MNKEFDKLAETLLQHEFGRTSLPGDSTILKKMKSIASKSSDERLQARYLTWFVRTNQLQLSPDSAIKILEKVFENLPEKYSYDRAIMSWQLARNYVRIGRYAKAWALLQNSIPALREAEDHYSLGNVYLHTGIIFQEIHYEKGALDNFDLAGREFLETDYPLNRVYFLKGAQLIDTKPQESVSFYKKSIAEGKDDAPTTIQAYVNLAYYYMKNGDNDQAENALEGAKSALDSEMAGHPIFEMMILTTEGDLLISKGDYTGALNKFQHLEKIRSQYTTDDYEPKFYYKLYDIYNRMGEQEKAFHYLQKYVTTYQAQVEEMQNQEVIRAKALEDIIRQEQLVFNLEQKAHFTKVKLYYSVAVLVLLCIVAGFIVHNLYKRIRNQRIAAADLKKNLEIEKDLAKLREENLQKDIELKNREISTSSLHLVTKNDALRQVDDIVAKFAEDDKISGSSASEISNVIRQSLRADDDWNKFRVHFDNMHPEFFTRLRKKYPDLTDHDHRLCAYILMGIRPKQIAELTSVTPASINTSRYRLRKKLGLNKDETLDEFLRKI